MGSVRRLTILFVLAVAFCGSGTAIAFDETDLKKFKAFDRCYECDLREANFEQDTLRSAFLREANLHKANLKGANLWSTSLEGANLREANLEGANLSIASLYGANLEGAKLEGAKLSGVDLSTAILKDANLDGAILCKTLTPWGEDNSGCEDAEPIAEAPKTEKSAAKYKVCKKTCADDFMVCIVDKLNIEPEACTETANQCLYSCKDKFQ